MGELRKIWQNTKKWSDDVASGKITFDFSSTDGGNTKTLIKSFSNGFGPALDKVEKAFKAKNDAETKKTAAAALTIAETYEKGITKAKGQLAAASYANFHVIIGSLITKLTELKTKGAAAKVDI
jgi:hypothetical protein